MTEPVSLHYAKQTLEAAQPKRHPAYPAYKPSGVSWLGDLPDHWDTLQLRRRFRLINGSTPSSGDDTYWDGDIVWVTPDDLGSSDKSEIVDSRRKISKEGYQSCGTTLAPPGSLVVSTRAPIGYVSIAAVPLCTNQGCRTLVPAKPLDSRYHYYLLLASGPELASRGRGSTFTELSKSELASVVIASPPLDEQQAIARFLDDQTKKIDDLIEAKRDLLALLKEKRQAIITHAVTKGLNPDDRLKPSGVDWLGDVPEHWDVLPVRRRTNRLQTGSTPPTQDEEYYENGSVAWYGPSSFSEAVAIGLPVKSINAQAVRDGVARLFAADSVLVVTIGATVGKIAWLPEAASTNQQITAMTFDSRRVFGKFAAYQLKSVEKILRSIAPSATLPILDQQEIASIPMAFPPREEQEVIVAHIDMEVGKLDSIIAETQQAIERLVELRTGVISATVTGKIDVRGGVA